MLLFKLLEGAIILAFAWALITQVIVPAIKGTTLFPSFHKQGELEAELAKAKQDKADAELAKVVEAVKSSAK